MSADLSQSTGVLGEIGDCIGFYPLVLLNSSQNAQFDSLSARVDALFELRHGRHMGADV